MSDKYEIIDGHAHIYPPQLAKKATESTKLCEASFADGTREAENQVMKKFGIVKSVILHVAGRPDTMQDVNRFALASRQENFITFGSVHPFAENVHEELEMPVSYTHLTLPTT